MHILPPTHRGYIVMSGKRIIMDNPYYLVWYMGKVVVVQAHGFQVVLVALPINI